MTPDQAAKRSAAEAAVLYALARAGGRVLYLASWRRDIDVAFDAFVAQLNLPHGDGDFICRRNGDEHYEHRPSGGRVVFAALDRGPVRPVFDMVAIAPDVVLTAPVLQDLALATPAGMLRTACWL